ncbi:MAG: hypothetical protein HY744_08365 [Deltaproteobacteria bacterium]|nr:hypothetical protein [Deltaproteobacteria bacterium]
MAPPGSCPGRTCPEPHESGDASGVPALLARRWPAEQLTTVPSVHAAVCPPTMTIIFTMTSDHDDLHHHFCPAR